MVNLYLVFESSVGFACFYISESDEIALQSIQANMRSYGRFKSICELTSFIPFGTQEEAAEAVTQISNNQVPESLVAFLNSTVMANEEDIILGVAQNDFGKALKEVFRCRMRSDEIVQELFRGVRMHFGQYLADKHDFRASDWNTSQIGLAHRFSRKAVEISAGRADSMIIQAICQYDQLAKDLNTHCMRFKEWYGWHFPELNKFVDEQVMYVKVAQFIGNKSSLSDESVEGLEAIVNDVHIAQAIVDAAASSMGQDITEIDLQQIHVHAERVIKLDEHRAQIHEYLMERMNDCAPNLTALMGEQVGARLISKAGSLLKLAKYPASTVQILGAEKALFRALKSRGKCNTPKYGLIYNSSHISRAAAKNKGKISRYLANKASMAVRLDCFLDERTNVYGIAFRQQVDERLEYLKNGTKPVGGQKKNVEVMEGVRERLDAQASEDVEMKGDAPPQPESGVVAAADDDGDVEMEAVEEEPKRKKKKRKKDKKEKKKKKKDKKKKKRAEEEGTAGGDVVEVEDAPPKKKKKKKDKKKKKKKKAAVDVEELPSTLEVN